MRIHRIRIDGFGRLQDVDTGADGLPPLLVVLGRNEAGKSTLSRFLVSMLYGFYPASRDGNPYTPWHGGDAQGALTLRMDSGGCVEVERRLRSSPQGRLRVDGRYEELRNRAVPWVEHVPLKVFEQVFSIDLAGLSEFDRTAWAGVQDRLIGAMGAADLHPARVVAEDLEREAGEMWRPNRRGNQAIRDLRTRTLALRERRRDAMERDRELRRIVASLETLRARLAEAREERQREKIAEERVQELLPIRSGLARIEALRNEAGDPVELHDLPPDPAEHLREAHRRRGRLAERFAEVEASRADPAAVVDALSDEDQALVAEGERIRSFLTQAMAAAGDRSRDDALAQDVRDLDRRLTTTAHRIFHTWSADHTGVVSALPLDEVRARVRAVARASERLRQLQHDRDAGSVRSAAPDGTPRWALTSVAVGAAALAVGLVAGASLAAILGAALLAAGASHLVSTRKVASEEASPEVALQRAQDEHVQAEASLQSLLRELPVSPAALEADGDALVSALERMQDLVRDRRERLALRDDLREPLARLDRDSRMLAARLARDTELPAETFARILEEDFRRAERADQSARSARRELARMDRELARLRHEEEAQATEAAAFHHRLARLGDGDPDRGVRRATERLEAASRATQLADELERAHPDLDRLRERIRVAEAAGESWTVDDEDVARRRFRIEGLTEGVEDMRAEVEGLERDLDHLRRAETVDEVEGELDELAARETRLIEERDRKWVLACLVREADRTFREEHQPDVLRRAGAHLAHLTGGRYDRILADDTPGAGLFRVSGSAVDAAVPLAPPLSTGTLEQAWLALRLAIVDHLDQGQERLPLFLDEVLVNWDPKRLERALDTLGAVAKTRQVVYFTCHPGMARRLEERGGSLLSLETG